MVTRTDLSRFGVDSFLGEDIEKGQQIQFQIICPDCGAINTRIYQGLGCMDFFVQDYDRTSGTMEIKCKICGLVDFV